MRKPDTYFAVGDWHFAAVPDVRSDVGDLGDKRVMLSLSCSPVDPSLTLGRVDIHRIHSMHAATATKDA
jgi:hypothetical protein